MARHRPKERHRPEDDDDESTTPSETYTLNALVASRMTAPLALDSCGPPRNDDEAKRDFYRDLVRLKVQRYSHRACADLLHVSERSIVNYISDPLYKEVQQEILAESKQRGHLLISEMIDDALNTVYGLMHTASSEFVRYKAAEKLLDVAGYTIPQEEAHQDARAGLSKFLEEIEKRRHTTNVNIHISSSENKEENTTFGQDGQAVIDGSIEYQQGEMDIYRQQVLPGGKLPPLPFVTTPLPMPDGPSSSESEKLD